jgi:hypothetical protein
MGPGLGLDTVPSGELELQSSIRGVPAEPRVYFHARGEQLFVAGVSAADITVAGNIDRSLRGRLAAEVDSLSLAGRTAEAISLTTTGGMDSATARIAAVIGESSVDGDLSLRTATDGRRVTLESLVVSEPGGIWRARPGGK